MSPRLYWRLLPGALLSLSALTGCGLLSGHGLPEDPLFINRKPLEARAVSAPPVVVARAEPAPPPNPYFAESRPAYAGEGARRTPRLVPGQLTGRPTTPAEPKE